jgi:hypothetical protein
VKAHISPEIPKKTLNSGLVENVACFFRKPLIFPIFPSISLYFVQAHNSTAKQQDIGHSRLIGAMNLPARTEKQGTER